MSDNGREGIRIVKTRRALLAAFTVLLDSHRFKKITVTDICEEALISRAAFYTYFVDKYDLLKYWLMDLWSKNTISEDAYEQIEKAANHFIHEHESMLRNLVCDADSETLGILFDFILSTVDFAVERKGSKETYSKDVVLSNFYAGGMICYLFWQTRNKFPADVQPMNIHLYEIINKIRTWKSEEERV